ncbi:hypothetical protein [Ruminococcus sp.]|jgi:hypothetical protein|uniref:hypothetical protein n=1 Tax=Ruminococcus sp. TaxID=41978 RepID=UPI0025E922FA|nr:hypothetical protein [Ruminococcus sp.]
MVQITAKHIKRTNDIKSTKVETSLSGSFVDILTELASGVIAVVNEITEPLPTEVKLKVTQDFITDVYVNIVEGNKGGIEEYGESKN